MRKYMKIEIKDELHLKAVRDELHSMDYWFNMDDGDNSNAKWIIISHPYLYDIYNNDRHIGDWALTVTLTDLLKMRLIS